MIKFCKKHGKQHPNFTFCPYCGLELNKSEVVCKSKYVLPKIRLSNDSTENLAFKEATAAAWIKIGVYGNISHMLAESGMSPEQIQTLLKEYSIEGVGTKGSAAIRRLNNSDFEKFNKTCELLKAKGSWCWNLAEWFYNLPDGCNCGQYMAKKLYFKKNTKEMQNMIRALYKVTFTEFERGWGQRPDGYALAKSKEIAEGVAKEYCSKCNSPELYSRANSEPRLIEVEDSIYNKVINSKKGYVWF